MPNSKDTGSGGSPPELEAHMSLRPIKRLIKAKPTFEGAGVHLRRAFGFGNTSDFDPFLLLDDFRNDITDDYLAGFPWHPPSGLSPNFHNTRMSWLVTQRSSCSKRFFRVSLNSRTNGS